jgi:hypothetical protein
LQEQHAADLEKQKQRQQDVLPGSATDYSAKTSGGFGNTVETNLVETVVELLGELF